MSQTSSRFLSALATLALIVVTPITQAHEAEDDSAAPLRVVTQNLYVGGDFTRIVDAMTQQPQMVPVAVAQTLQIINATNFTERAMAIADEIKRQQPDVVALQEVSLLRTQFPSDYLAGNPTMASAVLYDYLTMLMAALEARGMHYEVAASTQEADVEAPAFIGMDPLGNPLLMDVRLTDRDVILTRRSVKTRNAVSGNFAVNLEFQGPVGPVVFTRGYAGVDVSVRGQNYHVVNTHFEVPGPGLISAIQSAQANELAGVLAGQTLPVVLLGDFNSSPEDVVNTQLGIIPPYLLFGMYGYSDAGLLAGNTDPGYTCCQIETLNNPVSALSQRIDHIFVRAGVANPRWVSSLQARVEVFGNALSDKTASGLWPSDHAGVAGNLRVRAYH